MATVELGSNGKLLVKAGKRFTVIPESEYGETIDGVYNPITGIIVCPYYSTHIRDVYASK